MESGFVLIANRDEIIHDRVPCDREASPASRRRGWNDQAFAVKRPFGGNASFSMTDSCHAP